MRACIGAHIGVCIGAYRTVCKDACKGAYWGVQRSPYKGHIGVHRGCT